MLMPLQGVYILSLTQGDAPGYVLVGPSGRYLIYSKSYKIFLSRFTRTEGRRAKWKSTNGQRTKWKLNLDKNLSCIPKEKQILYHN